MNLDVAYMPVPRCETCAHWQHSTREPDRGVCRNDAVQEMVEHAYNFTRKDFGCVQWKEK